LGAESGPRRPGQNGRSTALSSVRKGHDDETIHCMRLSG
jgi:hypothetical protein